MVVGWSSFAVVVKKDTLSLPSENGVSLTSPLGFHFWICSLFILSISLSRLLLWDFVPYVTAFKLCTVTTIAMVWWLFVVTIFWVLWDNIITVVTVMVLNDAFNSLYIAVLKHCTETKDCWPVHGLLCTCTSIQVTKHVCLLTILSFSEEAKLSKFFNFYALIYYTFNKKAFLVLL
jgi:hypothetical protein